jgi:hypothetical protein
MRALVAAGIALVALGAAAPARAHTMSDGHLELVPDGRRLVGTLDVAVRDLHDVLDLDPGRDGAITWADVLARRDAIAAYVTDRLVLSSSDGACGLAVGALGAVDRPDGAHVAIALTATCPSPPADVTIDYRLLYELDAQHRGLLHAGEARAIAKVDGGPVTLAVRSGVLARVAGAVPGGAVGLAFAAAALALALAALILRRTSRRPLPQILAIAAVVSAPVWWSIHRLVS